MFIHFLKTILQLLRGLNGEKVIECAYVKSDVTEASYFSTPLVLGVCIICVKEITKQFIFLQKNGLSQNLGIGNVNKYEAELIKNAIPELKASIQKGEAFVNK